MLEPKKSAPSSIEKELTCLSKLQSNSGESSKACLFNLIVYSHEIRRTKYLKEVLKMIVSQFPCRIIFIQCNTNSKENYLHIKASTEKATEDCSIACDQIIIEASGQEIHKVNFLLLPLFVPDLPVYLLWGQDPTIENSILPHLQRFAARLIIDSESTDDLQAFSRNILNRLTSSTLQIVDMNWARTGGWREVMGQIFDSKERFEQLTLAKMIEIFYNDRPSEMFLHAEIQAIYLQAWLASRLNWTYHKTEKQNGSQVVYYKSEGTARQIKLTPRTDHKFEAEEILEMYFQGPDYECHLKRMSLDQVQVHAANQSQCVLPFTLLMPTLRSGRSFMQEIFYQKVSDHYAPMLNLISLVKWR